MRKMWRLWRNCAYTLKRELRTSAYRGYSPLVVQASACGSVHPRVFHRCCILLVSLEAMMVPINHAVAAQHDAAINTPEDLQAHFEQTYPNEDRTLFYPVFNGLGTRFYKSDRPMHPGG